MTGSIEFIVLATTKVGDSSLVVHTLSAEYGRRGFLVRPGKKASAALFMPLNILEADFVENPKSELWGLRNISARDALAGIRGNLHKNTMTLFLSEVLFRTVREGVLEDGLYPWCVGSILTLDALEGDFANFHIRWLLELAGALGFRPSLADIAPFAEDRITVLKLFLEADFGESMLIPLSGAVRNAIADDLLRYLEFHTEQPIRVKSLAVLRELYR
jgi:DNA repair protein RecO (recombination protein O)